MRSFRALAVATAFWAFSAAVADDVCDNGQCISDPSLTSDNSYRAPSSASPSVRSSRSLKSGSIHATDSVSGTTGAVATTVSSASTSDCVSPYPSLPLTAAQQQICEAGKARLVAAAEQKAKEAADQANQQQQQPQQQQPQQQQPQQQQQQPQSSNRQNNDGQSQNETDPCKKKLAQIVKECMDLGDEADDNCDPETDPGLTSAMSQMKQSSQGAGTSSYKSNNQASGGCAIGSQGMSKFAGTCTEGQVKMGKSTVGHAECTKECTELAQKVMSTPECKDSKNESDKKKAKEKIVSRRKACEALKEVADNAEQNAESLRQCSNSAGQNAAGGAGGLGNMIAALAAMAMKAQAEKDRQQSPAAVGAVDVCTDSAVMSGVPQICVCQKQGLDETACQSRVSYSVAPVTGGLQSGDVSDIVTTGTTGTTGTSGTVLPAGVTGP